MKLHLDALAWLHVIWGACGLLAGLSLGILAIGTWLAVADLGSEGPSGSAALWLFAVFGLLFAGVGAALTVTGRALLRRAPRGRPAALALAIPNLLAVPFGTALAVYTFWALLNDDARRAFGRPPHRSGAAAGGAGQ